MFLIFTGRFWRASELIIQPPGYPWTLGRIFFKKYQFVFDSLNKRVGYYKNKIVKNKEENIKVNNNIPETDNKETVETMTDTVKERDVIKNKKEENIKTKENIIEVNNKNSKLNENREIKDNKEKEIKEINNEINKINDDNSKITDSVFIVIFVVVLSIISVIIIGFSYDRLTNKKQRKKRVNELIDEAEYIPKEESKV